MVFVVWFDSDFYKKYYKNRNKLTCHGQIYIDESKIKIKRSRMFSGNVNDTLKKGHMHDLHVYHQITIEPPIFHKGLIDTLQERVPLPLTPEPPLPYIKAKDSAKT